MYGCLFYVVTSLTHSYLVKIFEKHVFHDDLIDFFFAKILGTSFDFYLHLVELVILFAMCLLCVGMTCFALSILT